MRRLDPLATVRQIQAHCKAGDFESVGEYVTPEDRPTVIAMLRAVDHLHAAAVALRDRVREEKGLAASASFDFTRVGDIAGVLSRDARAIDQHIRDDQATVTYQIGDRVPLRSVEMFHDGERWRPRAGIAGDVPANIAKLAGVLERSVSVAGGPDWTVESLRHDIDLYASPIIRRLKMRLEP